MIFPAQRKWDEWGITQEAHKFFVLRWEEIFDEKTFDSWQIRSTNVNVLIDELLEIVDMVSRFNPAHVNIKLVLDELKRSTRKDEITKKHFPFLSHYLDLLFAEYEQAKGKNTEQIDLANFKNLLLVIRGNFTTYKSILINGIVEILQAQQNNYKIGLYSLIDAFSVEIKRLGYSNRALKNSFQILTDNSILEFSDRFKKLNSVYDGSKNNYECLFVVNYLDKLENINIYNTIVSKERPEEYKNDDEERFYKLDSTAHIARVKVEATDKYSAREAAIKYIETLFSVSQVFLVDKKYGIRNQAVLVISEGEDPCLIDEDEARLKYVQPTSKPENKINDLSIILQNLSNEDKNQLNAAFQYHKLALLAQNDEARLVNLWIAMESLLHENGKSTITEISNYISTIDALGYVYRLMKALPISFSLLWKRSDTTQLRAGLVESDKYFLHRLDMLTIMLDKEEGNLLQPFISIIKENPLLIFRVNRIWTDDFGNPAKLLKLIQEHKQTVEWQICRIYRSRNLIIHKGQTRNDIRQLIQHLHTYFNIAIHTIISDLRKYKGWSISNVLEHKKRLFEFYVDKLSNYDNIPVSKEVLINAEKIMAVHNGTPAWSHERYLRN